jgi:multisubunit Na+/H+ antiporter MnhB subunit
MSRELEGMLFFGSIGIIFFIVCLFSLKKLGGRTNEPQSLLQALGLGLLLYGAAALWWFTTVKDGFSQVFGVMFYGGAYVLNVILAAALYARTVVLHKK